ncbi:MAG: energy transducer TonB, partial [Pontibacter sp.]|nr:energy transducer TonB [Pontibacter sp.]
QNLEGLMVTQFRITATGEVEKPSILKSLHPLLDLEVLRMVNGMPAWKPATQNGKPVSMLYTLPIRIRNGRMQMQQEEYFGRPSNLQYNSEVTPAGFNRRAVW